MPTVGRIHEWEAEINKALSEATFRLPLGGGPVEWGCWRDRWALAAGGPYNFCYLTYCGKPVGSNPVEMCDECYAAWTKESPNA